jgi:translocation and assembly module TamA
MWRPHIVLALALFATASSLGGQAHADEGAGSLFDGIKGLWSDSSENALHFSVELNIENGPSDMKAALEEASALVAQSDDGVPSVETMLALTREDPARLTAALYQLGCYSGRIEIAIAGQPVTEETQEIVLDGTRPVPVMINVDPGPFFRFGNVRIVSSGVPSISETAGKMAGDAGLVTGKPARSSAILETGRTIIADLKNQGYAFAKIETQDVTADHAAYTVSVSLTIAPGHRTSFGEVEFRGAERFSDDLLRSRAAIPVGQSYSPKDLEAARKRLARLQGIAGTRIIEGDQPDTNGRIPVIIDVTERKLHYFGASAAVSSIDGAELNGYWGHRNIYGNGETLRFDGTISNLGGDGLEDVEYEAKATVTWPSIYSAFTDYKTLLSVRHEEADSFGSDEAEAAAGVIRRFTPELTGEAAFQASWLQTEDALGENEFFLLSLPSELIHDTRDNTLEPTEGWRATLFVEPVTDLQNSTAYVRSRAQIATYAKLGGTPGIVAAARLGAGMTAGADLEDVPAPDRFLSGGGGSVRGYAFRSVGPLFGDDRIGGLSVVEMSGELRIRLTDTIGIVPFVDAAFVSSDSLFGGDSEAVVGAGLGLRYYTPIGPIRLDVATPLNELDDEPGIVVYVGLGQAF